MINIRKGKADGKGKRGLSPRNLRRLAEKKLKNKK
tara:strand:- start:8118 stop:8222 length:105 start_codon:yes stop_codon:yes gene_type:complete